jgi:hypothetical protein
LIRPRRPSRRAVEAEVWSRNHASVAFLPVEKNCGAI